MVIVSVAFQEAHDRMYTLLDLFIFSPDDVDLNKKVLTWPRNINPIFDQNDEVRYQCKLEIDQLTIDP